MVFKLAPHCIFNVFIGLPHHRLNQVRADIAGHHNHGVFKVHGSALSISQAAIVQHLQQDVEHIGMCLFHLIEQQHRIGFAPHRLGQVAALLVTHITWGRTYQTGHRVFFHEFTHVNAHQMVDTVKQKSSQGLAQLGFTHASRAQEQKRTCGPIGV